MRSRNTFVVIAVVALLAVGSVGMAVAGEQSTDYYSRFTAKVARILGKQPEEVRSAMTQAQKEIVDEEVAAGNIPEERAEKIKERIDEGKAPFPGFRGGMGEHRMGRGVRGEVAKVTGNTLIVQTCDGDKTVRLSEQTEFKKGEEVAERSDIKAGTRVAVRGEADSQGVVTAQTVMIIDGERWIGRGRGRSFGGFGGGMTGIMGQMKAITEFLGATPHELRSQLMEGKSLAEIAGSEKTPELIDLIVEAVQKQVEEAKSSGHLTDEQAAKVTNNLRERVTEMVNAKGMGGMMRGFPGFEPPDERVR